MEKVGVLLISYGSRAACIVDSLTKDGSYDVRIFDAGKHRNPFIDKYSDAHEATGGDIERIVSFAGKYKEKIDFGIAGPEDPIIAGVRDAIENKLDIPMICPSKEFAIEGSKVIQRELMAEVVPDANPRYRVFDPSEGMSREEVRKELWKWLDEFDNEVAVKPDIPVTGKGVGVWGDHFNTREELWEHFMSIYDSGARVIVEEKVDGEEFSLQFFSDGKHLISTPCVRDYKRAFDGDLGPNTGGMGSYKDTGNLLPFMQERDWEEGLRIGELIFNRLRGSGTNPGLRGIPMYMAYICTKDGVKVLEINGRPGDPEIMNILPILENNFVDICYDMINGNLTGMDFEKLATVTTYAVPMTYGGCRGKYSGSTVVVMDDAGSLQDKYGSNIRLYPGSMKLGDDGKTYALSSRALAVVGISDSIESARNISLDGVKSTDGALWNRWDIASKHHIGNSINHMRSLGGEK